MMIPADFSKNWRKGNGLDLLHVLELLIVLQTDISKFPLALTKINWGNFSRFLLDIKSRFFIVAVLVFSLNRWFILCLCRIKYIQTKSSDLNFLGSYSSPRSHICLKGLLWQKKPLQTNLIVLLLSSYTSPKCHFGCRTYFLIKEKE